MVQFGNKLYMNIYDEEKDNHSEVETQKKKSAKSGSFFKRLILIVAILLSFAFVSSAFAVYRAGSTYIKISDSNNPVWENILSFIPFNDNSFVGKLLASDESILEQDAERINVAVMGIRGKDDPNGGLLADTIMIMSINMEDNKLALISIPRDLYVKVPYTETMAKINFVHAHGEVNGGQGITLMKEILETVTGLKIHFAISVNFEAFKETVDILDGITVHVPKDFSETQQWQGEPFFVSAGDQKMDGETALLYARARYSTSDFDRARRQQEILVAVGNKASSAGVLLNPVKMNAFLDVIGDNVKTDMKVREMKKMVEIARKLDLGDVKKRVFDSTETGLLEDKITEIGEYILVPRGSTFAEINQVCRNIFNKEQ